MLIPTRHKQLFTSPNTEILRDVVFLIVKHLLGCDLRTYQHTWSLRVA